MIINGKWVDENNQANWSYGPNGGQGLFNPNQQKVYWNNGTPSYTAPTTTPGVNGQPPNTTFGATAPGWIAGGNPTTNPGTTLPGGTNNYTPPNTTYTRDLTPGLILGGVPTGSQNNGSPNPTNTTPTTNPTTLPPNLTGAPPSNYSPTAGGIPTVPNPGSTAADAVNANLSNFGNISDLAKLLASLNATTAAMPYNQNLPNYQNLLKTASDNALSNLRGQIPQDVINQITQSGAERGVNTGSPGGPNANSALLRALGLNSLNLTNTGQNQLNQLIGNTPTGKPFDPTTMFVDPNAEQMAKFAANLYNAAPVPYAAQNNALNALLNGLRNGRNQTNPNTNPNTRPDTNPTLSTVGDIINRYSNTANPYGSRNNAAPPPLYPDTTNYGSPINPETGEPYYDNNYTQNDNPEWPYWGGGDFGNWSDTYNGVNPETGESPWDYGGEGGDNVDSFYYDDNPEAGY